jgi:hypothetical protein
MYPSAIERRWDVQPSAGAVAPLQAMSPRPLSRAELEGYTRPAGHSGPVGGDRLVSSGRLSGLLAGGNRARLAIVSRPASIKPSIRTARGTSPSVAHGVSTLRVGMRETTAAPTPEQSAEREGTRYETARPGSAAEPVSLVSADVRRGPGVRDRRFIGWDPDSPRRRPRNAARSAAVLAAPVNQ